MRDQDNSEVELEATAGVPRERIGPFLLLGVDKDADSEQIEAQWARRVIAARRGRLEVPLADINWARAALKDPETRARADGNSLNADTLDGALRSLLARVTQAAPGAGSWKPMDSDAQPTDFVPTTAMPDPAEIARQIVLAEVPVETPGVLEIFRQLIGEPVDPWELELPPPS